MRKLSVCGKGGCGKSTVVSLIAKELLKRDHQVLVVDSDESNTGLSRMLGFEDRPTPLLELVGGKKNVFRTFSDETDPAGNVLLQEKTRVADLPREYVMESNGLRLVCIGKILQSLEGCACPMGVLSREFLGRLSLESDEVAVIDMEAGIEHFGRGVETSVDSVLIVVDPSYESLELAERIHTLAKEVGMTNLWTVLNRINSSEIQQKLEKILSEKGIQVLGSIRYDPVIFQSGLEGRSVTGEQAAEDIQGIVDGLLQTA